MIGPIKKEWNDISPFVVHFTKPSGDRSAYDNIMSILWHRTVRAKNRFGAGRKYPHSPKMSCFSEIPLHQLARLADKYGEYGVGFTKSLIVERDGGPIQYAYKDTSHAVAVRQMVEAGKNDPENPIWKIAPFIDLPGKYPTATYLFEWEREWRLPGPLTFDTDDVEFLIVPEELHSNARTFFADAQAENTGPSYFCPIIDARWNLKQVEAAFKPDTKGP